MKTWMRNLLPAIAITTTSTNAPASQDAASLLAAHRAGLGSPTALAALGVVQSRGTMVFEGYPTEGTYLQLLAPSGAARVEGHFEGIPPAVRATNGELFWMTGTGGVEIKKGWSAAADLRLFGIERHRDWRELYESAELVGETKVGERACYELRLVPKSPEALGIEAAAAEEAPAPDSWWLDRETKELARVAIYATVSGAGWQRLVIDYSDWRPVGGVRFPHASRMSFGPPEHALALAFECQSLVVDAELAADAFQPEEAVFAELAKQRSGDASRDPGFAVHDRKEVLTATVRVRCKPADLQRELSIILPEVMGYLNRERLTPVGPPFSRYHSFGAEIDLEAGIPVAEKVAGNERVRPSSLPGGKVVTGMHVGPYDQLGSTHAALAQWLERQGLTPQGGPWEVYWTDPGLERDPSKWRTEILQAVAPKPEGGGASGVGAQGSELERFGRLVGTWSVKSGPDGPHGTAHFEWLEGGHFLVQRCDLTHGVMKIKGIELIGRERKVGATEPSSAITSRFYDNMGNTLDYTWELEGDELTIWGGEKGSPVAFHGRFSADGNTLTGGWKWPGGGFDTTTTRMPEPNPVAGGEARTGN